MKNQMLLTIQLCVVLLAACDRPVKKHPNNGKPITIIKKTTKAEAVTEHTLTSILPGSKTVDGYSKSTSYQFKERPTDLEQKRPVTNVPPQEEIHTFSVDETNENAFSFQDIYRQLEKPFQNFSFSNQKDTVLSGLEGTILKVPANAFVSEKDNRPITGPVNLKLKEYYSLGDILLANLSTRSGQEMLETGGMLYIEAYAGDEKLKLKEGKSIELKFPTSDFKPGMQLFNGQWENNTIDWIVATSADSSIFEFVEQNPLFPGGETEMINFLIRQIKYPKDSQRKGIQGLVALSFVVDKDGSLRDFNILRGVAPDLNEEALRVARLMPKWIPGKQNGKAVKTRYTLPVRFSLDGENAVIISDNQSRFTKKFASNFERVNKDSIQEKQINNISFYLLSSSKLDWINCDRFYNSKSRINFTIKAIDTTQQDIKIVFHKIRSVLPSSFINKECVFYNVPTNENITIIALKNVNNKPYMAIRNTNTSKVLESALIYEEVTMKRLKEEMAKLNNF